LLTPYVRLNLALQFSDHTGTIQLNAGEDVRDAFLGVRSFSCHPSPISDDKMKEEMEKVKQHILGQRYLLLVESSLSELQRVYTIRSVEKVPFEVESSALIARIHSILGS